MMMVTGNKSPQSSTSMLNSPSLVTFVQSSSSHVTPSPTLNKYKFNLAFMPTSFMSAPSTPKSYTSDDRLEKEIAVETVCQDTYGQEEEDELIKRKCRI
eukprot:12161259-Ditylum_brightwellii.AAC.1